MYSDILDLVLGVVLSSGVTAALIYVFRDAIGALFTKSIEHRFERKLEAFRSDIRGNEAELDQIRSYLTSAQRERDGLFQKRRIESAEALLKARFVLSQLTVIVEFMKNLNMDNIIKSDDPRVAQVIENIMKPFDIDKKLEKYAEIDKVTPRLYLSESSIIAFDMYEAILFEALMLMKVSSIDIKDRGDFIKKSNLSKRIQDLVPSSRSGFEKFGDGYVYYWFNYFHDEILTSLRHEVSGLDEGDRDSKTVERLAVESRRAQERARLSLTQAGMPDQFLKSDNQIDIPSAQ